jgi:hypothetical protein
MLKVVCAWCKRDMGEKMGPDGMTTHVICRNCMEVELAKFAKEKEVGNGRVNASQG